MRADTQLITPELAAIMLERSNGAKFNTSRGTAYRNRTVTQSVVDKYADDMRHGHWRLTSQTIAVTADGILVDGQHRLHAVIQSGTAIPMLVVTDADPDTFYVIDTGRQRNASAFIEAPYRANIAAVAKAMLRLEELNGIADSSLSGGAYPLHAILEYLEKNPQITERVARYGKDASYASRVSSGKTTTSGLLLAGQILDDETCARWWNDVRKISSGDGLPLGNPVRALLARRSDDRKDKAEQSNSGNRTSRSYLRALYAAAVKYRRGQELEVIYDANCKTVRVW